MRKLVWFVRACALYNALGIVMFLTPGLLGMVGVEPPDSRFWVWLPALMATFPTVMLFLASRDLERLAFIPYWNGIIRLLFVVATFAFGFGRTAGPFVMYLALGDLPLALGAILAVPRVLGRTHRSLLTSR